MTYEEWSTMAVVLGSALGFIVATGLTLWAAWVWFENRDKR
jgi:hypothetical protein